MESVESPPYEFSARACTDHAEQVQALRELAPGTLFLELTPTPAKNVSRSSEPWIFTLSCNGRVDGVAAGFLCEDRIARSLVVTLVPKLPAAAAFWNGLERFARSHRASNVSIESLGEIRSAIPRLAGERQRITGDIFMIDLKRDPCVSKHHRRNIRKAIANGAEMIQQGAGDAIRDHVRLCRASATRRSLRGATGSRGGPKEWRLKVYQDSGKAVFLQAGVSNQVLSSDLIVTLGDAAYYVSGGTAPEGMKIGTSHFLMNEIIGRLRRSNFRTLGLGFTSTTALARFKSGFGARRVPIETVDLYWGSPMGRLLRQMASIVKK
jgi:hypothetical protein